MWIPAINSQQAVYLSKFLEHPVHLVSIRHCEDRMQNMCKCFNRAHVQVPGILLHDLCQSDKVQMLED
eukprot:scaffold105355_cov17-Tisochrysis_lutea.AAC.3